MNMIKVLWSIFPHCLGTFTMPLVKGSLKQYFLDIYHFKFPESGPSKIQNEWRSSFLAKCLKFNVDFKNSSKNSEKVFCFWDNCIWNGIVKLSLCSARYFSLAPNVLTSSLKNLHVRKRHFSNSISLEVKNESDKCALIQISIVLAHVSHIAGRSIL